jgi:hypothetical protein
MHSGKMHMAPSFLLRSIVKELFFYCLIFIISKPGTNMPNILLTEKDQVKNIEGTHACVPKGFKTWKRYWIHETGRDWPKKCRISGCSELAIGGGHVHIHGHSTEVYIIPMCNTCNNPQNMAWMTVKTRTEAVNVEKADTSGPEGICHN